VVIDRESSPECEGEREVLVTSHVIGVEADEVRPHCEVCTGHGTIRGLGVCPLCIFVHDAALAAALHEPRAGADTWSEIDAALARALSDAEQHQGAQLESDEALAIALRQGEQQQLETDAALATALHKEEEQRHGAQLESDAALAAALHKEEAQHQGAQLESDAALAAALHKEEEHHQGAQLESDAALAAALHGEEEQHHGSQLESDAALATALHEEEAQARDQEEATARDAVRRIVQLCTLACPGASQGLHAAFESLAPSLHGMKEGEARSVPIQAGHPLLEFLGAVRREVHRRSGTPAPRQAQPAAAQLLILPGHTAAFVRKMEELRAAGRPCLPCVAFHSTPHRDAVRGISTGNFDPEKCGRHDQGYYGRGTYFHMNIAQGGAGGDTFLSLILKGREYSVSGANGRGPKLGAPLEPGYDSHVASDRLQTGETVIFHQDQMLPLMLYR